MLTYKLEYHFSKNDLIINKIIKSKNTSKVARDFDEDCTLSGSLVTTDQYHVFIYIRVNE